MKEHLEAIEAVKDVDRTPKTRDQEWFARATTDIDTSADLILDLFNAYNKKNVSRLDNLSKNFEAIRTTTPAIPINPTTTPDMTIPVANNTSQNNVGVSSIVSLFSRLRGK